MNPTPIPNPNRAADQPFGAASVAAVASATAASAATSLAALPDELQPATLAVDMATIRAYAELTGDFNPIHLDPVFAAQTPMGGVIAHGTMSIGLLWQALHRSVPAPAFNDLDLDVRFVKPVRVGEVLTAGGARQPDGRYAVWVNGPEGEPRLAGHVQVKA